MQQYTKTQVAVLVQAYLLDVVRRSWIEDGWPPKKDVATEPAQTQTVLEFLLLKLPLALPSFSATTFPWSQAFAHDLLRYLRTLSWPEGTARCPFAGSPRQFVPESANHV